MSEISEVLYLNAAGAVFAIDIQHYPAGEPLIRDGAVPSRVLLRPETLETFLATLFWFDALAERGYLPPELVLPCVPGARQDRLFGPGGDQLFTAKSIARELNARRLRTVTVVDPHSDVTPALIDRCVVVQPADLFSTIKGTWGGVIAPDGGAAKRAAAVARSLGVRLYHGWKVRDVQDGSLRGFGIEPLPMGLRAPMLIVDDLCDGGGTFIGLAETIKRTYPHVVLDLFVTHGLFTQGTDKLTTAFGRVITTDSVAQTRSANVEVLPICRRLLVRGAVG